jgi:hypothetical protein
MMRHLLFCALLLAGACSRQGGSDAQEPASQERAAASAGDEVPAGFDKLKFKDADDRERFSLKAREDGAKLVDGDDRELARYKWKGASLKVSGPDDAVLGHIVGSAGGALTVRDPAQTQILFTLARQGTGWRLNDGKGTLLYTVSPDDDGARIQDGSGASVAHVKVREGKVSVRDNEGRMLLATKSLIRPDAAAVLAFEKLDLPMRGALLFFLQTPSNPEGRTP